MAETLEAEHDDHDGEGRVQGDDEKGHDVRDAADDGYAALAEAVVDEVRGDG